MKPNDSPIYVNKNSNHPPSILRNIPIAVNRRISNISANEQVFRDAAPAYQDALKKSGYDHEMKYEPPKPSQGKSKNRKRNNIIWFNPPWSVNCKTKVAATFLKIVTTCFTKYHPLRKIFNRNTLKVSYSCLPNMAKVISNHNFKVKNQTKEKVDPGCNCKKGVNNCPLKGACQMQGVVYGAKVTNNSDQTSEFYTGLTARPFKKRLYEHTTSFNKEKKRHKTTLSDHVWSLKLQGDPYTIS